MVGITQEMASVRSRASSSGSNAHVLSRAIVREIRDSDAARANLMRAAFEAKEMGETAIARELRMRAKEKEATKNFMLDLLWELHSLRREARRQRVVH